MTTTEIFFREASNTSGVPFAPDLPFSSEQQFAQGSGQLAAWASKYYERWNSFEEFVADELQTRSYDDAISRIHELADAFLAHKKYVELIHAMEWIFENPLSSADQRAEAARRRLVDGLRFDHRQRDSIEFLEEAIRGLEIILSQDGLSPVTKSRTHLGIGIFNTLFKQQRLSLAIEQFHIARECETTSDKCVAWALEGLAYCYMMQNKFMASSESYDLYRQHPFPAEIEKDYALYVATLARVFAGYVDVDDRLEELAKSGNDHYRAHVLECVKDRAVRFQALFQLRQYAVALLGNDAESATTVEQVFQRVIDDLGVTDPSKLPLNAIVELTRRLSNGIAAVEATLEAEADKKTVDNEKNEWQSHEMPFQEDGMDSLNPAGNENFRYLRVDGSRIDDTDEPFLEWMANKDESEQIKACVEWISRVAELMSKWSSREFGDIETADWARALYGIGVDCGDVIDRNLKARSTATITTWNKVQEGANRSLRSLALIFGAMAHLERTVGQESSLEARSKALKTAQEIDQRLRTIDTFDPS